jgi:Siphovirus Gp157
MTALYVLADEYRGAAQALADLDLDAQTVSDTLEGMAGALELKAVNVAMFARNLESLADQIRLAELAMGVRRKALESRAVSLRAYLINAMQTTGILKIEAPQFRLAVRDNPESVDVFDVAQVPAEFLEPPPPPPAPAPDKAAIKAAIKSGVEVPGCRVTRAQRLEIK